MTVEKDPEVAPTQRPTTYHRMEAPEKVSDETTVMVDVEALRSDIYGGILITIGDTFSERAIAHLLLSLGKKYENWWRGCRMRGGMVVFQSNEEYNQKRKGLMRQVGRELAERGHSIIMTSYDIDNDACVESFGMNLLEFRASGLEMVNIARAVDPNISSIKIESVK